MNFRRGIMCVKRVIALTIVSGMLFTPVFAYSEPSDWAKAEVEGALNNGLVTESITSDYQKKITRENFCELVVKLYEKMTSRRALEGNDVFVDTDNMEILKAYNLGIVKGVSDNEFAPDNNITRQEICVMLTRCIDIAIEDADVSQYNTNAFSDITLIADWALPSVNYAFDNGIIKGVGNNQVDPLGNTTCEQAILMVYRIYNNYQKNAEIIENKNDTDTENGESIVFEDEAFEYSVRRSIALDLDYEWGTTYDGEITEDLLNDVTRLLLYDLPNGKKLTSIADIDNLNNLKIIKFGNDINSVTDMEVISDSEVDFSEFAFELCVRMSLPNGNRNRDGSIYIGEISEDMLQKITELSTIHLPDNMKLSNLEDLKLTPNINKLELYRENTDISDFSEIANLKDLKQLNLWGIQIEDDSFLYDLNLTSGICFPMMQMPLYLDDEFNYQEALKVYETIKQKLRFLESELSKIETNYDKYKIIHDYLVEKMEYDYDYVRNSDMYGNFIYMSLYEERGVCADYSYTYQYLCEYFGLECWIVSGDAKGIIYEGGTPSWGFGHAWNIVKIDGEYYHIDVTFDDPVGVDTLRYDYFLVSDDTISADHIWGGSEYGEEMFGSTTEKIPFCSKNFENN